MKLGMLTWVTLGAVKFATGAGVKLTRGVQWATTATTGFVGRRAVAYVGSFSFLL